MQLTVERFFPTPVSNSPLLPLLLLTLAKQKHSPDTVNTFKAEYDYIIVGAGTAGSVVASRLSDLPCINVLLLEAGHEPPLLTEVPAFGRYFWTSDIDWGYKTVPQKYTGAGFINRQLPWLGGKMIGGSSASSSMVYARGNIKTYELWEEMGATGWNYNDVYPYFLKLEDNRDIPFLANGDHAFGGPMTVKQPSYQPKVKQAMYETADLLGYRVIDSNAARQTGFYDHQANIRRDQRCSTAKAYLVPVESRKNLDILSKAMVTKVIIRNGRATGVQFDFQGFKYEVKARREVIVSAGATNTPQILKLSGVGPSDELQRLGIPVAANIPAVGENMQNHAGIYYPFVLDPFRPNFDEKLADPRNVNMYIQNKRGPLASTDGYYFTAFLKGLSVCPLDDLPNYELYITETTSNFLRHSGITPEVYQQVYGPYENQAIFTCTISQINPRSKGTILLQSKNPYDPPLINPKYLDNSEDVEDMIEGLRNCRRIVTSAPFRRIGAKPLETLVPGCESFENDETGYFKCLLETVVFSFAHATSTARMGNPLDPTTVVDPELKVKNIKGLRVVDASVMPVIAIGNTHTPTVMIAEKASDIIKKTIRCFGNGSRLLNPYDDRL